MAGAWVGSFGERMKHYPKTGTRAKTHSGWWRVAGLPAVRDCHTKQPVTPWMYFEARSNGRAYTMAKSICRAPRRLERVEDAPALIPAGLIPGVFIEAKL